MSSKLDIDAINEILGQNSKYLLTDAELGLRAASGIPTSENQKRATSLANSVSRTRAPWSAERKQAAAAVCATRIAERNALRATGILVQVMSAQGRENISRAGKGRKQSPEALRKRSESMKRTLALKKQISGKQS